MTFLPFLQQGSRLQDVCEISFEKKCIFSCFNFLKRAKQAFPLLTPAWSLLNTTIRFDTRSNMTSPVYFNNSLRGLLEVLWTFQSWTELAVQVLDFGSMVFDAIGKGLKNVVETSKVSQIWQEISAPFVQGPLGIFLPVAWSSLAWILGLCGSIVQQKGIAIAASCCLASFPL